MGRVNDVGLHLLGDERESGLLPGQSGRPVRDCGRAGDDARGRRDPPVSLRIGSLADDGEICVGMVERRYQPVDVPSDAAAVSRNSRRIDENTGRHVGPLLLTGE
jgi:hypothetical protein